jgi:hypothetical protein
MVVTMKNVFCDLMPCGTCKRLTSSNPRDDFLQCRIFLTLFSHMLVCNTHADSASRTNVDMCSANCCFNFSGHFQCMHECFISPILSSGSHNLNF